MAYFDLFVAPVAADAKDRYLDFTRKMQEMILSCGAVECVDLWGEDVPDGEVTSFPMAVKLKPGEVVASGYVIWPSKEVRDAGWGRIMEEAADIPMPFDGKRMVMGGFNEFHRSGG